METTGRETHREDHVLQISHAAALDHPALEAVRVVVEAVRVVVGVADRAVDCQQSLAQPAG